MAYPKRAGRKPVSTRIGSRDDWRGKLNAALERRGERTIQPRDEIAAEFRRSKYFSDVEKAGGERQGA